VSGVWAFPAFVGQFDALKIRSQDYFEKSGSDHPPMQRHIPEERNLELQSLLPPSSTLSTAVTSNLQSLGTTRGRCLVSAVGVRLHTEMKIFLRFGVSCNCHLQVEGGLLGSPYTYPAAGDVTTRAAHTSRCQIYVRATPPVPPRFVNPEECNCSACRNVGKSPLLYAAQQPNLT
jgi:hypothetical protein